MLFAFSKKKRQEPSPQLSVSSTSLSAAAGLINLKGEKPMPRHTLISTVGTSLLESNLRRLAEKDFPKPDNWEELYGAFQKENWKAVASKLLELSPGDRVCGAEINTVEEIFKKGMNYIRSIFFLISDTPRGRQTGEVLRHYFLSRKDLKLDTVECHVIEKLQDENPKVFKTHGLRNLVRTIGALVQRTGGPEFVNIDATGGYKAQIALAVIMGQSLGIPVFYKHERFNTIIDFPPLPVAFDYSVLGENAHALSLFEKGEVLSSSDLGTIDEKLKVFLYEAEEKEETLYELSPLGQIYLTGYRLRYPTQVRLVPSPASEKKEPSFRDDHFPDGFKDFVFKVWKETPWITNAHSLPYDKQKSIKGNGFYVREVNEDRALVGTYRDKNLFGARFRLHLTDSSPDALTWAAEYLNREYGS